MFDPRDVRTTFLTEGVGALRSLTTLFALNFEQFRIGDMTGFVPAQSEVDPRGNIVWTGSRTAIQVDYMDDNMSVRVAMTIPEDTPTMNIGNLVLYAYSRGEVRPVVSLVLPEVIRKNDPSNDRLNLGFPQTGNRLIIGLTLKYVSAEEIQTSYTIDIETPEYSNLPSFENFDTVPAPESNAWSQFIVNDMDRYGSVPVLVSKTTDNEYYASPLAQNIASPKFGIIDFGAKDRRVTHIFGGWYLKTLPNRESVPGGSYDNDVVEETTRINGGGY